MTIAQGLRWAVTKLKSKTSTPILDAEVLLSHAVKHNKTWLYTHNDKILTAGQIKKFKALISRRAKYEPVAYLIGTKEFYGRNFFVDKRALIPRPETEMMIDEVLKLDHVNTIADIGTGSGCIAVTLKKERPEIKILASDISKSALKLAQKNASYHQAKIIFKSGDLLTPIKNEQLDIIVANLPYIDKKIIKATNINSKGLKFEPKNALFAKQGGLELYIELIKQISQLPHRPKYLVLEISPEQKSKIEKMITKTLAPKNIQTKTDLAGRYRIVVTQL